MKRALFSILTAVSVIAQSSSDGTIVFKNLGIQNAAGTGTYNVPLFASSGYPIHVGSTIPAGSLPGGVTVGLFLSSNLTTPLAIGQLGTATPSQQFYIITPTPSQTVTVPGFAPGSTPSLTIRAWTTRSGSFTAASSLQGLMNGEQSGEWIITAKPLGGVPAGGGTPITPPTLTGWGAENGSGFELNGIPEPSTIALSVLGVGAFVLARRCK